MTAQEVVRLICRCLQTVAFGGAQQLLLRYTLIKGLRYIFLQYSFFFTMSDFSNFKPNALPNQEMLPTEELVSRELEFDFEFESHPDSPCWRLGGGGVGR